MKVKLKKFGKTWYGWYIWKDSTQKVKLMMPPGLFDEKDQELEVTILASH